MLPLVCLCLNRICTSGGAEWHRACVRVRGVAADTIAPGCQILIMIGCRYAGHFCTFLHVTLLTPPKHISAVTSPDNIL